MQNDEIIKELSFTICDSNVDYAEHDLRQLTCRNNLEWLWPICRHNLADLALIVLAKKKKCWRQRNLLTTIQNIKLIFATSVTVNLYDSIIDSLAAWVAWYDILASIASSAWQSVQTKTTSINVLIRKETSENGSTAVQTLAMADSLKTILHYDGGVNKWHFTDCVS